MEYLWYLCYCSSQVPLKIVFQESTGGSVDGGREVVMYSDQGNFASAQQSLVDARLTMANMPPSPTLMEEQQILEDLEADYCEGNLSRARKKAFSQVLNRSHSGRSKPRRSLDGE